MPVFMTDKGDFRARVGCGEPANRINRESMASNAPKSLLRISDQVTIDAFRFSTHPTGGS